MLRTSLIDAHSALRIFLEHMLEQCTAIGLKKISCVFLGQSVIEHFLKADEEIIATPIQANQIVEFAFDQA